MKNKGFTLVELSIVLVVIGLLIGGILVGKSLIDSARMNSFISQIQQYDGAIATFKSKYKYLPGDAPQFPMPATQTRTSGAGDGLVSMLNDPAATYGWDGEIACFWNHLAAVGLKGSYSCKQGGPITYGVDMPESKLKKGTDITVMYLHWFDGSRWWRYGNAYVVGQSVPTGGHSWNVSSAYAPSTVAALDNKIDDGVADTGFLRAAQTASNSNAIFPGGTDTVGTGCVENGNQAAYQVSSTNDSACAMIIKIMATVGQHKQDDN